MTRLRGFYILAFFLLTTLAYNNCSNDQFQRLQSTGFANSASSQCRAKIISNAKASTTALKSSVAPAACEVATNYHCDLRRFRPTGSKNFSAMTKSSACLPIVGLPLGRFEENCVSVATYNFDTTLQLREAASEDGLEGGAYNRDEVTCINTQVTSRDVALIQTEGSTVHEALQKAINLCQQWSGL